MTTSLVPVCDLSWWTFHGSTFLFNFTLTILHNTDHDLWPQWPVRVTCIHSPGNLLRHYSYGRTSDRIGMAKFSWWHHTHSPWSNPTWIILTSDHRYISWPLVSLSVRSDLTRPGVRISGGLKAILLKISFQGRLQCEIDTWYYTKAWYCTNVHAFILHGHVNIKSWFFSAINAHIASKQDISSR